MEINTCVLTSFAAAVAKNQAILVYLLLFNHAICSFLSFKEDSIELIPVLKWYLKFFHLICTCGGMVQVQNRDHRI